MKLILISWFAATVLFASPSFADWKGNLEVHGAGAKAEPQSTGQIFAKGHKLRFEIQAQGHEMIILADAKANTASMLMPAQKMFMEMPASMADKQMMACSTDDIEGCFKVKGYKKTGTDTVDGHPCVVYEGDEKHGQNGAHQKIWRPTDLKQVFMIKSLTIADGHEITTLVKDIKVGKLEDAIFKVPAEYKKMQMPDFGAMHH